MGGNFLKETANTFVIASWATSVLVFADMVTGASATEYLDHHITGIDEDYSIGKKWAIGGISFLIILLAATYFDEPRKSKS